MAFLFQKHRRKLIAAVASSIILTCLGRYIYLYTAASSAVNDIDLLSKFCYQHQNWSLQSSSSSSSKQDARKQPQWISSLDSQDSTHTEKDRASHLLVESIQPDIDMDSDVWDGVPVKGAFYMIVHNQELAMARASIRSMEDRFNSKLNASYPWVLLNSQRFTPDFKKYIRKITSGKVYFGQIDLDAWSYPEWIDAKRTENAIQRMIYLNVEDSHSLFHRKTMRYKAGLFQYHSLLKDVEYAWRVEPGSTYTCNMFHENDPFLEMKQNKKTIGFSITKKENPATSFSLWPATLQFMRLNPEMVAPADMSIMPWLVNKNREYNFCHMSSDFELVNLSFLRSEEYQAFFRYLDYVGGFFYERWSDGSVRSLAAAMFLERKEIQFFNQVGYTYNSASHCPLKKPLLDQCACDYKESYNVKSKSCTFDLLKLIDREAIEDMIIFAESQSNK